MTHDYEDDQNRERVDGRLRLALADPYAVPLTRKGDLPGMISLLVRKRGRAVGFIKPTLEVTSGDHILFSTDCPAAPEPTVVGNITNLTRFDGFTADQLCGVERDNALRLSPLLA